MDNQTALITSGVSGVISLVSIGISIYLVYKRKEDEADLRKLQSRLDEELQKNVHVYKFQFEKEFQIYEEIWEPLVDLKGSLLKIDDGPVLQGQRSEDMLQENINLFKECDKFLQLFEKKVEMNRPFYNSEVYEILKKIEKCSSFRIFNSKHTWSREVIVQKWEEGQENKQKLLNEIEYSCEAIRKRIAGMKVKSE